MTRSEYDSLYGIPALIDSDIAGPATVPYRGQPRVREQEPQKMERFTEYEATMWRTVPPIANGGGDAEMILGALGLAGEAGEYADHVKKYLYHNHPANREKALEELGDILWCLAYAARRWGASLGEIALLNTIKLQKRYPQGWSAERSLYREQEEWR